MHYKCTLCKGVTSVSKDSKEKPCCLFCQADKDPAPAGNIYIYATDKKSYDTLRSNG